MDNSLGILGQWASPFQARGLADPKTRKRVFRKCLVARKRRTASSHPSIQPNGINSSKRPPTYPRNPSTYESLRTPFQALDQNPFLPAFTGVSNARDNLTPTQNNSGIENQPCDLAESRELRNGQAEAGMRTRWA